MGRGARGTTSFDGDVNLPLEVCKINQNIPTLSTINPILRGCNNSSDGFSSCLDTWLIMS